MFICQTSYCPSWRANEQIAFDLQISKVTPNEQRGKTYAHASTLAFPVCLIFFWYSLVCCYNKNLWKNMLYFSSISFNFLVRRFRKSLQQCKAVRTNMSVIINRCLLFSSSWHRRLVVRMWCKPIFLVHCGVAFVTPPCTWLVSMISRPYGIQNSIKSRWNTLFPKARANDILWEPSTWSSAALAKSSERKYILPAQIRLLLLAFPHFAA